MSERGEALREAVERSRSEWRGPRWRCPAVLRQEIVAFARERQAEGEGIGSVARRVGVSESGLGRWFRGGEKGDAEASFRPVRFELAERSGGDLVLVTPRGYRVEGLTVASVAELLGRL